MGLFREDLYYRLKVITIGVPPLRERKEDIPLLVSHLLEKANRELHKSVRKAPDRVMEMLMDYPWPGNIRELENVITRGVLLAKGDVLLDLYISAGHGASEGGAELQYAWKATSLDDVEREHIQRTLEHTGWNKSRAAILLGITPPRLDRKIRKYNLRGQMAGKHPSFEKTAAS
jgi:two-component system, NtrC family, response regulator HydG